MTSTLPDVIAPRGSTEHDPILFGDHVALVHVMRHPEHGEHVAALTADQRAILAASGWDLEPCPPLAPAAVAPEPLTFRRIAPYMAVTREDLGLAPGETLDGRPAPHDLAHDLAELAREWEAATEFDYRHGHHERPRLSYADAAKRVRAILVKHGRVDT